MFPEQIIGTESSNWLFHPSFPKHWRKKHLYPLAKWVNGLPFRDSQFSSSGMPVIKIAEIKNGITGQTKFTNQTFDNKVLVKSGDMLFSWSGQPETSIGVFWWRGCDGWLNQHVFKITPNEELDQKFFFYLLRDLKPNFVAIARNKQPTGLGHVTKGNLEEIVAAVPPLAEQKEIAASLGALDDKIELNRQMNATLEAMAHALFQSWFVDFDPVRRNAEGGAKRPEDSRFPDSFEDSAIGGGPAGWKVMPLYETATYRNGAAFKTADFCPNGEGLPVVKIAELKSGLSEQTKWSNKQLGSDQMIDTGDLLYSWSGSPDTSLDAFLWSNGPGLVNQHIFKVITSSDAEKRFVYYLLKHLRPILVETARDKQTTGLGHVTVADMKRLQVCRPPKDVLAAFDRLIAPIFDKAFTNTLESQTLATLRDTLLPRLLSGEFQPITVPNHRSI